MSASDICHLVVLGTHTLCGMWKRPPTIIIRPPAQNHSQKYHHSFSIFWLYLASYTSSVVLLFFPPHITTILVWAEVQTFHCSKYQPPVFPSYETSNTSLELAIIWDCLAR
ncbi:hypothetical protein PILCRDRAFT_466137 [Piloderma croceum F 1598]|uniref:Uncharacterized protein n=1 Tax=Piloderma croceum (strain F 1598) TaxID=765440 RepID=A0A0C3BYT7_PILCF|nr:hypothetical protein PILCRDRAFT_466137 [Piloderma croceum F 1598]